jgi:hypothetical protein
MRIGDMRVDNVSLDKWYTQYCRTEQRETENSQSEHRQRVGRGLATWTVVGEQPSRSICPVFPTYVLSTGEIM